MKKESIWKILKTMIIVFVGMTLFVYFLPWLLANFTIEYERQLKALRKYEATK